MQLTNDKLKSFGTKGENMGANHPSWQRSAELPISSNLRPQWQSETLVALQFFFTGSICSLIKGLCTGDNVPTPFQHPSTPVKQDIKY